jgi:ligand-binding SRPBCC domain-containing protein
MRFKIKTLVQQPHYQVFKGFNQELFLQLAPPFPPVKLLQFEGCKTNDWVKLELNFIFFKQIWASLIVEDKTTAEEIYFIDEGKELPFFLKFWRHRHRIVKQGEKTLIIDDIQFKTPFWLTDFIFFPLLYLQFAYRVPIYKKVFKKSHS